MDEQRDRMPDSGPEAAADVSAADVAEDEVRGRYGEPWQTLSPRRHSESPDIGEAEPAESDAADDDSSGVGIVGHLQNVAEPIADLVSPVAGAIGSVIGVASTAWSLRDSPTERRLKRQAKEPLLNLYEAHPEAALASPRELGLRFVPIEDIVGTAVAGITQRGGDFLPLKQLRGENWLGRWRRIQDANERLQPLPPVDLIKYDGEYWVVDGHNRVAAMLYANGVGVDAMVIEMVPLDGMASERPTNLLSLYNETEDRRTAAAGVRPVEPAEPPDPAEPNPSGPEDPAR